MGVNIFLGIWNEDKLRRIKIEDVDLDSNVETLKIHLTKELGNNANEFFELTYCGHSLEDNTSLSSYGISSGGIIHVTDKLAEYDSLIEVEPVKITGAQIQEFLTAYKSFKSSPNFRNTLHRLEIPAELDKVIAAVPGLEGNPISIAFISKPDIFSQMEDPKTCLEIAERQPLIILAAQYIMTEFHNFTSGSNPSLQPPPISGHSYSLDALSDDDEDMDGEASTSAGAITAAQLAAALAAASAGHSRITPEMLQQALSSPGAGNSSSRYSSQIQQMRELGMGDEARNLRALLTANGDLQAAIDLVFSGALDD